MRSRRDAMRCALLAAALLIGTAGGAAATEPVAVTPERVRSVVAELQADPSNAGSHTERRLRWKRDDEPPKAASPSSMPWLLELVRWLSNAGRGIVWLLGALAVALLIVFAWRWANVRADASRARDVLRPSHVNDLDIRPESLPADIAAAARALLQRGEQRAALSLLYRGALSRLVHVHGIAIRAASTEGECLRLAQRVLPAEAGAFFERLVRAWQTEVYAGRASEAASVAALCAGFDTHFAAPAASTAHGKAVIA